MSRPLLDLGDGIEVRYLEPRDADDVFAVIDSNRDRLRPWMPWVDGTVGPADTRAFIERDRASNGMDALGIYVDGGYIGGIGIRPDTAHGDAEIGYWIGSAHEGRGLVTRACRALIDLAFGELGLHRVTIRAAPDNARSRAIPERLGFREEGVLREAGRSALGHHDLVVYGLLDREWRSG
ncbi:MAG: GNAT family protein [Actinomycetota bacterium]